MKAKEDRTRAEALFVYGKHTFLKKTSNMFDSLSHFLLSPWSKIPR